MALNFLVTGVKMLKKSLDKKKMKDGAKKFVGGDKEEKRAKVGKIVAEMDEEPKAKVIKSDKLNCEVMKEFDIKERKMVMYYTPLLLKRIQ